MENKIIYIFILILIIASSSTLKAQRFSEKNKPTKEKLPHQVMIRIAEIEIDSNYINEYNAILKEEAEASLMLEPGVISIFPMYVQAKPATVRILEIYRNKAAYEAHLKTPHFLKYKTETAEMVKRLELVEMGSLDPGMMKAIFRKLK